MKQTRIAFEENKEDLGRYIKDNGIKKLMLVCGKSAHNLEAYDYLEKTSLEHGFAVVQFSDYEPNPTYDSVIIGVKLFRDSFCDGIMAIGGGSAIDVAKCIKAFSSMQGNGDDGEFLKQEIDEKGIPFIAMPTTAGTGSESTRFAVIYYKGEKCSVSGSDILPNAIILDADVLTSLPSYQRKATMLDAFCHALESFWSVNSNDESKMHSRKAIQGILENFRGYLQNEKEANGRMLVAANTAGLAIDVTQTTAGHAMCYKLTSLYGLSHGHSAAFCVLVLWKWMLDNVDKCIDSRGQEYVETVFKDIASSMGASDEKDAVRMFDDIIDELEIRRPEIQDADYDVLVSSVNVERLKNNPIKLNEEDIRFLYHEIAMER